MKIKVLIISFILIFGGLSLKAQMPAIPVRPQAQTTPKRTPVVQNTPQPQLPVKPVVQEDNTLWYLALFLLVGALGGAIFWQLKLKKQDQDKLTEDEKKKNKNKKNEPVDADKELEWLRKNKELIDKRKVRKNVKPADSLPNSNVFVENGFAKEVPIQTNSDEKKVQLSNGMDMPIYQIQHLEKANPFHQLSYSNDESLLGAIEQTHEEDEEDEMVRDIAVKILAMFRNRNSVEALSQVALYDLSSSLRVKALITLCDFDHESVFEPILLACADPTREVRAAAARCLTKLSFNRADAWARITELKDQWRMKASAKAAIESGLVERSFDRLTHNDYKHVYEAFALIALLIKTGETELVVERLENHPDLNVRMAILHIIKVLNASNTAQDLYRIAVKSDLTHEFSDALEATIQKVGDLQMVA